MALDLTKVTLGNPTRKSDFDQLIDNFIDLAGAGRTTETVEDNADDIATNTAAIAILEESYETAWINRSDWTNVHIGSDDTKNADSNVTHSLGVPLSDLLVRVLISTDGTDANSFEIHFGSSTTNSLGITVYQVDSNNIKVQTGLAGIYQLNDSGSVVLIDTENWWYKIVVKRIK